MEAWREIVNASLEHLKEYEEGTAAVRYLPLPTLMKRPEATTESKKNCPSTPSPRTKQHQKHNHDHDHQTQSTFANIP